MAPCRNSNWVNSQMLVRRVTAVQRAQSHIHTHTHQRATRKFRRPAGHVTVELLAWICWGTEGLEFSVQWVHGWSMLYGMTQP